MTRTKLRLLHITALATLLWTTTPLAQAQTLAQPIAQSNPQPLTPQPIARGLQNPWSLAFLPTGEFLVTERPGRLRVLAANGTVGTPVQGVPEVAAGGQGGLLDVVLDSGFASNRTLYFCFSEPGASGGNSTALARAQLARNPDRLENLRVVFSQRPKVASSAHFGCRIVEGRTAQGQPDGTLFMTLGDRFSRSQDAQTLDNHHGKVIRIHKDGSVPADNPLVQRAGALPEIWSWGHRNPQGATLAPDGKLWVHEHGPQGGDEINLALPGRNYGWPAISYGVHYGGAKIGEGASAKPGMEQPLHYWTPSIAPSGMAFVTSERYGKDWVGNLVVASLKFGRLHRLELAQPFAGKVVRETTLLTDLGQRIRDVRQGPDGLLYVLTDQSNGQLLRLDLK
jgi:glucose/arabinose dehydrogenase